MWSSQKRQISTTGCEYQSRYLTFLWLVLNFWNSFFFSSSLTWKRLISLSRQMCVDFQVSRPCNRISFTEILSFSLSDFSLLCRSFVIYTRKESLVLAYSKKVQNLEQIAFFNWNSNHFTENRHWVFKEGAKLKCWLTVAQPVKFPTWVCSMKTRENLGNNKEKLQPLELRCPLNKALNLQQRRCSFLMATSRK